MMHTMRRFVMGIALSAITMSGAAGSVHAQEEAPSGPQAEEGGSGYLGWLSSGRILLHVNGGYQVGDTRYARNTDFRVYGERARFLVSEQFAGTTHVDAGGVLSLWRELEIGASYTQVGRSGTAVVTGSVPHPLDVGRDRTVPAQTLTLPHRQRATHVYASWRFRPSGPWSLAFSAGPTYFNLRQGFVANLTPSEAGGPPFAGVDLGAATGEHTRNGVGFNAGLDVTVMLTPDRPGPRLGVGYFVRLALGSIDVQSTTGAQDTYHVGGVQTGGGLRVLF